MRIRSLATFLAGAVLGGALVYGALSYKHSTGPFRGDRGRIEGRHAAWAKPLASQSLRNFHQVSGELYRGAQPDRHGFVELERLGIKTVVNLRLTSSDKKLLEGTSLSPVDIPAEPWDLEEPDILAFLRVVVDPVRVPVFVHCSHGADRTGAMVAIYRVVLQGWDKEGAIREMTEGGFGYHTVWDNLPATIRKLDVAAVKAKLGEAIEQVGKEVGLTFPTGTKLIGVHRERGADDLIAIKVEMPAAAWPAFLETTPIEADQFRPGERGLLGPDHGFWDPHRAKNLRTAQAALPGSRVLNLGYDDSQGAAIAVFVVNHGT